MTTTTRNAGLVEVNGVELYHEVKGAGPGVVFVPGGNGDGGGFDEVADRLASSFTTLRYDRRGFARSEGARGETTTVTQQVDDLVGLIDVVGLDRPAVVGHSNGGVIVVALAQERPEVVSGVLAHEPGLATVAPSFDEFQEGATAAMADGLARGDFAGASADMGRWFFGADAYDSIPAELQARGETSMEYNFTVEVPVFSTWEPDAARLAAVDLPVHAAIGATSTEPCRWLIEAAEWVADAAGTPLHTFPGGHLGPMECPEDWADALAEVLRAHLLPKEG